MCAFTWTLNCSEVHFIFHSEEIKKNENLCISSLSFQFHLCRPILVPPFRCHCIHSHSASIRHYKPSHHNQHHHFIILYVILLNKKRLHCYNLSRIKPLSLSHFKTTTNTKRKLSSSFSYVLFFYFDSFDIIFIPFYFKLNNNGIWGRKRNYCITMQRAFGDSTEGHLQMSYSSSGYFVNRLHFGIGSNAMTQYSIYAFALCAQWLGVVLLRDIWCGFVPFMSVSDRRRKSSNGMKTMNECF